MDGSLPRKVNDAKFVKNIIFFGKICARYTIHISDNCKGVFTLTETR